MPLTELVYCVTVAFTMTQRADQRIYISAPAHSTALMQAFFFWQNITSPRSVSTIIAQIWLPMTSVFSQNWNAAEREEICKCGGHTVHKLSLRRLTARWLAPQESDHSQVCNEVSSDWLPSYIKATWPVLEMFKMAGYFPEEASYSQSPFFSTDIHRWLPGSYCT